MNLYEITENYRRLLDAIDEGIIPEEAIKDTLDAVEGELSDKLDNIACAVKSLNAEAAAIKSEIGALTERQKAKANEAARLIDYMHDAMNGAGKAKIETARCLLSIKKNPEAVAIKDMAKFIEWAKVNNKELLTYAPPVPNKTQIKEAIKTGASIPECKIERGERLEIK